MGEFEDGFCESGAVIGETGQVKEGTLVEMHIIGCDELLPLLEVFRLKVTLSPYPRA